MIFLILFGLRYLVSVVVSFVIEMMLCLCGCFGVVVGLNRCWKDCLRIVLMYWCVGDWVVVLVVEFVEVDDGVVFIFVFRLSCCVCGLYGWNGLDVCYIGIFFSILMLIWLVVILCSVMMVGLLWFLIFGVWFCVSCCV